MLDCMGKEDKLWFVCFFWLWFCVILCDSVYFFYDSVVSCVLMRISV